MLLRYVFEMLLVLHLHHLQVTVPLEGEDPVAGEQVLGTDEGRLLVCLNGQVAMVFGFLVLQVRFLKLHEPGAKLRIVIALALSKSSLTINVSRFDP